MYVKSKIKHTVCVDTESRQKSLVYGASAIDRRHRGEAIPLHPSVSHIVKSTEHTDCRSGSREGKLSSLSPYLRRSSIHSHSIGDCTPPPITKEAIPCRNQRPRGSSARRESGNKTRVSDLTTGTTQHTAVQATFGCSVNQRGTPIYTSPLMEMRREGGAVRGTQKQAQRQPREDNEREKRVVATWIKVRARQRSQCSWRCSEDCTLWVPSPARTRLPTFFVRCPPAAATTTTTQQQAQQTKTLTPRAMPLCSGEISALAPSALFQRATAAAVAMRSAVAAVPTGD